MNSAFWLGQGCWQEHVLTVERLGQFLYRVGTKDGLFEGIAFDWKQDGKPWCHLPMEAAMAIRVYQFEKRRIGMPDAVCISTYLPGMLTETKFRLTTYLQIRYTGFLFDWAIEGS